MLAAERKYEPWWSLRDTYTLIVFKRLFSIITRYLSVSGPVLNGYLSESIERAEQHFEEINLSFAACLLFHRGWVGEVRLVPFHLPANFMENFKFCDQC